MKKKTDRPKPISLKPDQHITKERLERAVEIINQRQGPLAAKQTVHGLIKQVLGIKLSEIEQEYGLPPIEIEGISEQSQIARKIVRKTTPPRKEKSA